MDAPGPARLYAALAGAALAALGIVGFFYSASFGSPGEVGEVFGIFAANGWVNLVHALTGALGLIAADRHSRRYSQVAGAFYVLLGFWGFAIGSGEAVLGLLPANAADNLLYLFLGALGLLAARGTPTAEGEERAATA